MKSSMFSLILLFFFFSFSYEFKFKQEICKNAVTATLKITPFEDLDIKIFSKTNDNRVTSIRTLFQVAGNRIVHLTRVFSFVKFPEQCKPIKENELFYTGDWIKIRLPGRIPREALLIQNCSSFIPANQVNRQMLYFLAFDRNCN